jgi:hypothetical protein
MIELFRNEYTGPQDCQVTAMRAFKKTHKPERVVIAFPVSKSDPESADLLMRTPKSTVWAWLELGFLATLASSVVFSMLLVLVAAGNAAE